jgi:hypothetical protein
MHEVLGQGREPGGDGVSADWMPEDPWPDNALGSMREARVLQHALDEALTRGGITRLIAACEALSQDDLRWLAFCRTVDRAEAELRRGPGEGQ